MVETAKARGAKDNVTALIVEIRSIGKQRPPASNTTEEDVTL